MMPAQRDNQAARRAMPTPAITSNLKMSVTPPLLTDASAGVMAQFPRACCSRDSLSSRLRCSRT